ITGAITYLSLRSFLYNRLDQQVGTSARQNAEVLRNFRYPRTNQIELVSAGERLWFSLIDSDGQVATITIPQSARSQIATLQLAPDQVQNFIAHPNRTTRVVSGGEPLHAQSVAVSDGNYVVIGLSTREVERTVHRLVLLEVGIGLGVVILAAALTSWGVRAGLAPLRRVTRTAQEVTAELGPDGSGLDRRVPVDGAAEEVEHVARSVNTLLHAVETEFAARLRSEERMRQFLADASHELRTPLTSIRGYAELARLRGDAPVNDQSMAGGGDDSEDFMRRIEVEGTRMSRLVEDLLVLARGDQGTVLRREPVEVDQLLSEAASAVHSAHPDRVFELGPSGGAVVIGDRDQLLRVLINLATNAAVHTPATGPIRIEAAAGPSARGPIVALRVLDNGPGLPPEEAEHVFERFWRADKARTRAKGGSGLGMAIVAQIVQAHGGTVHFESSVHAGTTVTVTLPGPQPHVPLPGQPGQPGLAGLLPGQPAVPATGQLPLPPVAEPVPPPNRQN
ncbi:MAG: HAMP domain-containing sensor histidine kinase, partial [Jatrophihabitantaceae bacterium]